MSLLQYGAIRLPPGYKQRLEAKSLELERVNEAARVSIARSDEYDKLASDQLALNSLMYSMAEHLNDKHNIGLSLPDRPLSRDNFKDIQRDARVSAYSLLALAHIMSVTIDQSDANVDAARDNDPAQKYDRPDPGSEHISVNDITGHTVAITDIFGSLNAQTETYDDHIPYSVPVTSSTEVSTNITVIPHQSKLVRSTRVTPMIR